MKRFHLLGLFLFAWCRLVGAKGHGGHGGHSSHGSSHSSTSHSSISHTTSYAHTTSSGGRSSSSNSGGTSFWGGRRSRGGGCSSANDGEDGCSITTTEAGLFMLFPFLFLALFQLGQCRWGPLKKRSWNMNITRAEEEILKDAAAVAKNGGYSITEAMPGIVNFVAGYTDTSNNAGAATLSSSGTLEFSSRFEEIKSIVGNGSDQDGCFAIMQGKLSPSGRCYWLEETPAGQAIITGTFLPDNGGVLTFEGQWMANNGAHGKFSSFDITPKVYLSHQAPQLSQSRPSVLAGNRSYKKQALLLDDDAPVAVVFEREQGGRSPIAPPNIV